MKKNIFKQMWEVWDNIDRAVAIGGIIAILLSCSIMCCSCDSTTYKFPSIQNIEGNGIIDTWREPLYIENVVDMVYDPVEDRYYIEYHDHGIRYDEETELITENYNPIIHIYTNKVFFEDFMNWYNLHKDIDYPCTIYDIKVIETVTDWEFSLTHR